MDVKPSFRKLDFVRNYQDAILVTSNEHEQHRRHLKELISLLQATKLQINKDKCQSGKSGAVYTGFQVCENRFRPPEPEIQAISDLPKPTDLSQLAIFHYYWHCAPHAAELQAPLTKLLAGCMNKKSQINWTIDADSTFEDCKNFCC